MLKFRIDIWRLDGLSKKLNVNKCNRKQKPTKILDPCFKFIASIKLLLNTDFMKLVTYNLVQ